MPSAPTLSTVGELPIGGTAVGTGLNCPPGFAQAVVTRLARDLELPLSEAPDHFAAHGARDSLVSLSGALRTLAVALVKIGNDIRWMGSGPRTGLAEIRLPDLQPGSSIMPGKVNPVMAEADDPGRRAGDRQRRRGGLRRARRATSSSTSTCR